MYIDETLSLRFVERRKKTFKCRLNLMMSELRVFNEKDILFGIFSDDYDLTHPLNEFYISSKGELNYIWDFKQDDDPDLNGCMLNLQYMIGETINNFRKEDQLYLIKDDGKYFAIKMNDQVKSIDVTKETCTFQDNNGDLNHINFSLNMLVPKVYVSHRKKIYILEPKNIRSALRHIL